MSQSCWHGGPAVACRGCLTPAVARRGCLTPAVARRECLTPAVARRECLTPAVARRECLTPAVACRECPTPAVARRECLTPAVARRECLTPAVARPECLTPAVAFRECLTPVPATALGSELHRASDPRVQCRGNDREGVHRDETLQRAARGASSARAQRCRVPPDCGRFRFSVPIILFPRDSRSGYEPSRSSCPRERRIVHLYHRPIVASRCIERAAVDRSADRRLNASPAKHERFRAGRSSATATRSIA